MAQAERRRSERKALDQLTYIDIAGGNGGVVTDICEDGLGFRAIAPIAKAEAVQFVLSWHSAGIQGAGNVVWTDETRRVGGLSFTEFPEEIREQIRRRPARRQLPAEPSTEGRSPDLHYGDPYTPGVIPDAAPGSYYREYFPESTEEDRAPGEPSPLLKTIKVSLVAVMIVVAAFLAFRASQKPATSNAASAQQQAAKTSAPTASSNSPAIGLSQSGAQTGSEAPSVSSAANSSAAPSNSNAAQAGLNQPSVRHEVEAEQPMILVVQVAAVPQEADAYKILNALKQKHFNAFISPPVNDQLFRVQLGPYQTPEDARASVAALEKAGFKPFMVISR